ncbi:MAG: hypothetical protein COX40_00525 [Candidatus Omnitrophica bacterium CG23_combo_of_CG06-09_8_20_14_all_40_11]|nr:MAG: hypothetical protein COX40_00525 [Candidatus Omnitrophica bacterium CG23_combo_of_CG06-09_8_20_14_all_40_11]
MQLKEIHRPIEQELLEVEQLLRQSLKTSRHKSILGIGDYLLGTLGKKLRPSLVILSSKAILSHQPQATSHQLIKIATAIELIHVASLIHDDVIDSADLRHHKPSINAKWGQDVSIALGDYLYSIAFELISDCGNSDILRCISSATKSMCEGELLQVCERDNPDLLKERYFLIVKKKTAALFAASCQAGAILVNQNRIIQGALKNYGLNFGIAFQIMDDYLDLIGETEDLGKTPGADFRMGELTLPVLNLLAQGKDRNRILSLIREQNNPEAFRELRQSFINSEADLKTKDDVSHYIQKAKESLNNLENSSFKQGLFALTDYVADRIDIRE